jgi:hypothetical protein
MTKLRADLVKIFTSSSSLSLSFGFWKDDILLRLKYQLCCPEVWVVNHFFALPASRLGAGVVAILIAIAWQLIRSACIQRNWCNLPLRELHFLGLIALKIKDSGPFESKGRCDSTLRYNIIPIK